MSLNVAVIGCGNISKFHFSGLKKAGAKVTWVCDLDEAAAARWAEATGARVTSDYTEVMADPAVQLVDITAFSGVHKPMALAAIEAGKAVVVEKTLAEGADDALEIVRAARDKGTILFTSYMKRFIPAVEKARQLLPRIGRVLTTSIRAFQCWGDLWTEAPAEGFAHTPPGGRSEIVRRYGGGILVCGGSHILDLVCFLLGRPHKLLATLHTPEGRDYDLQAAALLLTDNGPVHYEALSHPLSKIGFLRDGWDETVEITGTSGRLTVYSSSWDAVDSKASLLVHYDNTTGTETEYRFDPVSPFDRAIGFFCQQVEQGRQGTQPETTGYDVDELIETIKRSAKSGQAEEVKYRI